VVGVDWPDLADFLGGVEMLAGVRAEEREAGSSTTGIGRRVFIGDDEDPDCCDTDLALVALGNSGMVSTVLCVGWSFD